MDLCVVVTVGTTKFHIQKFCVPPTQCIYVFCMDLRTNSDYFVYTTLIGVYNLNTNQRCLLRGTN